MTMIKKTMLIKLTTFALAAALVDGLDAVRVGANGNAGATRRNSRKSPQERRSGL